MVLFSSLSGSEIHSIILCKQWAAEKIPLSKWIPKDGHVLDISFNGSKNVLTITRHDCLAMNDIEGFFQDRRYRLSLCLVSPFRKCRAILPEDNVSRRSSKNLLCVVCSRVCFIRPWLCSWTFSEKKKGNLTSSEQKRKISRRLIYAVAKNTETRHRGEDDMNRKEAMLLSIWTSILGNQ